MERLGVWYRIVGEEELDEDGSCLFWSNELGWVDKESADVFSLEERMTLELPVGGAWINVLDC